MAAKSRLVERGECIVVEQGAPMPAGVEGGLGFSLGLLAALAWCVFR